MSESSGFATTTLGSMFWSERFASMLALRRVRRLPASDLGALTEGDVVKVVGTVRALGPVVTSPLTGRSSVFGRLLACRPVSGLVGRARERAECVADVVFGGAFLLDSGSMSARIEVSAEDAFELFVTCKRGRVGDRGALDALGAARGGTRAPIAPDWNGASRCAEWAIEVGSELGVIGRVVRLEAVKPVEPAGYRTTRFAPTLAARRDKPLVLFGVD